MVARARLNAGVPEGKPRTQAVAPWDIAASICQGTNSDRPGLWGQCYRAVPRARKGQGTCGKGQPEVGLPESGSGAWSVKRVTCSSPRLPSAGTRGSAIVVSQQDAGDTVPEWGSGHPALPQVLLAAGLHPLFRAVAVCRR